MKELRSNKHLFGAAIGLVLSACCIVTSPALGDVTVKIDPSVTYQTMIGWEVSGRMWQFDKDADRFNDEWEFHAPEILDTLVDELGINRFRLEALSGMENPNDYWTPFVNGDIGYEEMRDHFYEKVNDNDDPFETDINGFNFGYIDYIVEKMLLPVKQRVESNDEELYLNLTYVDFKWTDLRGNLEHATEPDEYAEFVLVVFDHLNQKYGLIPDAFELILEADNTIAWSGGNIGTALLVVKALLNENGYFPEFIAPSTALASRTKQYFDGIQDVSGAADALDELSYHRYDGTVTDNSLTTISSLAETWSLRTSMLEHVGADYDELMDDLLIAQASAWQQYGIATNLSDNPGGYYLKFDATASEGQQIYLDRRAVAFSIVFPYVRKNALRIDTQTDDERLKAASFVNSDDSMVTLVSTDSSSDLNIQGLANGDYKILHANADGELSMVRELTVDNDASVAIEILPGLTSIVDIGAGLAAFTDSDSSGSTDDSSDDSTDASDQGSNEDSGNDQSQSSSSGALSPYLIFLLLLGLPVTVYRRMHYKA